MYSHIMTPLVGSIAICRRSACDTGRFIVTKLPEIIALDSTATSTTTRTNKMITSTCSARTKQQRRRLRMDLGCHRMSSSNHDENVSPRAILVIVRDYIQALRPVTILQAVGSFLVGTLILMRKTGLYYLNQDGSSSTFLAAMLSIYISYGAGMVMNDAVDIDLDMKSEDKRDRAIASGRISRRSAWIYCTILSTISMAFASQVHSKFLLWTLSNVMFMFGYASGFQKVLLVKNISCGLLAVSPLIGSCVYSGLYRSTGNSSNILLRVALLGFMMQFAREVLKDIEDMEIDQGRKMTLPMFMGKNASHALAYSIVAMAFIMSIFDPFYRHVFSSKFYVYPLATAVAFPMCINASMLSINQGQKLLKKSIHILLAGMISSLVFG